MNRGQRENRRWYLDNICHRSLSYQNILIWLHWMISSILIMKKRVSNRAATNYFVFCINFVPDFVFIPFHFVLFNAKPTKWWILCILYTILCHFVQFCVSLAKLFHLPIWYITTQPLHCCPFIILSLPSSCTHPHTENICSQCRWMRAKREVRRGDCWLRQKSLWHSKMIGSCKLKFVSESFVILNQIKRSSRKKAAPRIVKRRLTIEYF